MEELLAALDEEKQHRLASEAGAEQAWEAARLSGLERNALLIVSFWSIEQ